MFQRKKRLVKIYFRIVELEDSRNGFFENILLLQCELQCKLFTFHSNDFVHLTEILFFILTLLWKIYSLKVLHNIWLQFTNIFLLYTPESAVQKTHRVLAYGLEGWCGNHLLNVVKTKGICISIYINGRLCN